MRLTLREMLKQRLRAALISIGWYRLVDAFWAWKRRGRYGR